MKSAQSKARQSAHPVHAGLSAKWRAEPAELPMIMHIVTSTGRLWAHQHHAMVRFGSSHASHLHFRCHACAGTQTQQATTAINAWPLRPISQLERSTHLPVADATGPLPCRQESWFLHHQDAYRILKSNHPLTVLYCRAKSTTTGLSAY